MAIAAMERVTAVEVNRMAAARYIFESFKQVLKLILENNVRNEFCLLMLSLESRLERMKEILIDPYIVFDTSAIGFDATFIVCLTSYLQNEHFDRSRCLVNDPEASVGYCLESESSRLSYTV